MGEHFSFGWKRLIGTGVIFSLLHFAVLYRYGYPYTDFGAVLVTSDPLTYILNEGFLNLDTVYQIQVNYFTGNPFFLIPLFEVFGAGPGSQRLVLIMIASTTTLFTFLAYNNIFDWKKSVLGILVLFNFSAYLTFWTMDYPYVLASISLLFYLFTEWYENGKQKGIYPLAFLSGLFFYFKAIIAYFVVSVGVATLLKDREFVISAMEPEKLVPVLMLFLIGISPFLLYSYGTDLGFLQDATNAEDNYGLIQEAGYEPSLTNIAGFRITHLNYLLNPFSHYEVGEFPYHPRIEWPSIMSLLLIFSTLYAVYRPDTRIYGLTLLGLFAFSLYVTNDINPQQLIILFPFIPISFLAVFEKVTESEYWHEKLYFVASAILVLGIIVSIPVLAQNIEDIQPRDADGDQQKYEDFSDIGIEGNVATNTWEVYRASAFSISVHDRKFISPPDLPDKSFVPHLERDRIGPEELDTDTGDHIFVLYTGECPGICGYETGYVLDKYGYEKGDAEIHSIGDTEYRVFR